MLTKPKTLALLSLSLLSAAAFAVNAQSSHQHVVVAPQCLLKNINSSFTTLASTSELALIATDATVIDKLIAAKIVRTATPCGGFIDASAAWNDYQPKSLTADQRAKTFLTSYATPAKKSTHLAKAKYKITHKVEVRQLLKQINSQEIWTNLTAFSNTDSSQFPDRYAKSANGVKAAAWLQAAIEKLAKDNNRSDITVYTVATGTAYKQPSVVVKIGDSNAAGIVIGGHMDTLSSNWGVKPGADDDGSGSMTVMEVARTLIASGMHFNKPIYIIWYSAEEEGLIGSGYVVKDFQAKNIPVDAVLQFDMTGYANKNDPTMWLITDNVNADLTDYLEKLITTYVKQPVGKTRCGYACSDHASWDQAGFTAAFPFEASFGNDDPYIHTSDDTMAPLSLSHMTDFAKLGVAFAVELAEPAV